MLAGSATVNMELSNSEKLGHDRLKWCICVVLFLLSISGMLVLEMEHNKYVDSIIYFETLDQCSLMGSGDLTSCYNNSLSFWLSPLCHMTLCDRGDEVELYFQKRMNSSVYGYFLSVHEFDRLVAQAVNITQAIEIMWLNQVKASL